MKKAAIFFTALIAAGFLLSSGLFYVVPVNEHAVVTRFGKIVNVHSTPGIHVKIPFLDSVTPYPKWLQEHDSQPVETVLGDKRNVIFDTFLLYSIDDPKVFHTKIRNASTLARRIDDIVFGSIRVVAGLHNYESFLSEKRDEIIQLTTERVRTHASDMGISVVKVAIRNFTLPEQNLQAIFVF